MNPLNLFKPVPVTTQTSETEKKVKMHPKPIHSEYRGVFKERRYVIYVNNTPHGFCRVQRYKAEFIKEKKGYLHPYGYVSANEFYCTVDWFSELYPRLSQVYSLILKAEIDCKLYGQEPMLIENIPFYMHGYRYQHVYS